MAESEKIDGGGGGRGGGRGRVGRRHPDRYRANLRRDSTVGIGGGDKRWEQSQREGATGFGTQRSERLAPSHFSQ